MPKKKKKATIKEEKKETNIVKTIFTKNRILTDNSDESRELYNKSRYGAMIEDGRVQLSILESLYLLEKGKIDLVDGRGKSIDFEKFFKKSIKDEKNLWVKYCVFKDIRNRGYIIKTALKFGADFRVYDRGIKPGEDHAKWVVYPVHEGSGLTWHDFAAKNRVAHSTKKRLLIGIVDEEGSVTYYEIAWKRP